MGKVKIVVKKPANWTPEEMSIHADHLYYLLQTLTENYNSMEDAQRFSLLETAWNFSGDVSKWLSVIGGGSEKAN